MRCPSRDTGALRELRAAGRRAGLAADAASSYRPAHAETAAKTFDVAATRRRPVVFEADDLDVPDFLK